MSLSGSGQTIAWGHNPAPPPRVELSGDEAQRCEDAIYREGAAIVTTCGQLRGH